MRTSSGGESNESSPLMFDQFSHIFPKKTQSNIYKLEDEEQSSASGREGNKTKIARQRRKRNQSPRNGEPATQRTNNNKKDKPNKTNVKYPAGGVGERDKKKVGEWTKGKEGGRGQVVYELLLSYHHRGPLIT